MNTAHLRIPPLWMPSRGRGNVSSRARTAEQARKDDEHRRCLLLQNRERAILAAMSVPMDQAEANFRDWLAADDIADLEQVLSLSNGQWTDAELELEPYICPQWGYPRAPPEGRHLPSAFIIAEYRRARHTIAGGQPPMELRIEGKSACMPDGEDLEDLYQEVIHQEFGVRDWYYNLSGKHWEGTDYELGNLVACSRHWDGSWCPDPYRGKKDASTQYEAQAADQIYGLDVVIDLTTD